MRKILPGLLLFLLSALNSYGQSTTISGTVTDAGGQTWNNGTIQFTFVPNPQYPVGPYVWTGGTLQTTVSGTLNTGGAYSISIPANTAISPIGSSWTIQVCSQATFPCFTTQNITITGTTMNFNVTPPAISISLINPTASPMVAYTDAEISSANIGSYYYSLPNQTFRVCQAVSGQACTLFANVGTGGSSGFPRLDQVLNQNQNKIFNQGSATAGFTAGPGFDLSGETSPFTVPLIAGCTTSANGQICFDPTGLNFHGFNGLDSILALFPPSVTSGDVAGFLLSGAKQTLQDLGPVNATSGNSFLNVSMTSPLTGDVPCYDSTGPPLWPNCTPGASDTSLAGATGTYLVSITDNLTTLDHDSAGSASVTVTLPTAITLGLSPGFVFIYSNHSSHIDTITPTTWTINGAANLNVASNAFCRVRVDPASATNWIADCTGAGVPGGANTQVQYNNSGAFAGNLNFAFDNVNNTVGIGTAYGDGTALSGLGLGPSSTAPVSLVAATHQANSVNVSNWIINGVQFGALYTGTASLTSSFLIGTTSAAQYNSSAASPSFSIIGGNNFAYLKNGSLVSGTSGVVNGIQSNVQIDAGGTTANANSGFFTYHVSGTITNSLSGILVAPGVPSGGTYTGANISGIHIQDLNDSTSAHQPNQYAGLLVDAQSAAGAYAIKTGTGKVELGDAATLDKAVISGGTAATLSGTGACATITTQTGGAWAGQATCTGSTAASTLTITPGITAPHGWVCSVQDQTTRANLFQQTANTATNCTLTVTSVTANDIFVFSAIAF